jgi:hypothetical protein
MHRYSVQLPVSSRDAVFAVRKALRFADDRSTDVDHVDLEEADHNVVMVESLRSNVGARRGRADGDSSSYGTWADHHSQFLDDSDEPATHSGVPGLQLGPVAKPLWVTSPYLNDAEKQDEDVRQLGLLGTAASLVDRLAKDLDRLSGSFKDLARESASELPDATEVGRAEAKRLAERLGTVQVNLTRLLARVRGNEVPTEAFFVVRDRR